MKVLSVATVDEALAAKAAYPEAVPIAGGTDLLVDLNFGRLRPEVILDLSRVRELDSLSDGEVVEVGALTTFARIILESEPGALVEAARTVGSPQIRNRATIGGNIGTASPAGDSLPVLSAYDAEVVIGSEDARRRIPIDDFFLGPRQHALEPHELILGVSWERMRGPSVFAKIGARNAMVISVANVCLAVDPQKRVARIALGSVGPTIIRARAAEDLLGRAIARVGLWDDPDAALDSDAISQVADAVADAAAPIDDLRGTSQYRRHACRVLSSRAIRWALPTSTTQSERG